MYEINAQLLVFLIRLKCKILKFRNVKLKYSVYVTICHNGHFQINSKKSNPDIYHLHINYQG